jgi:ATP-binding cassette subfamily C exporter for protease/lipase
VRLDGADIYQWNKDELGPHIGYLPQDIELFAAPCRENIARFGEVDPEKVVQAAKRAGVHDMILHFPRATTRPWATAAPACPAARSSASAWRAPCTATRRCWCWTSRIRTWTTSASKALVEAINDLRQRGKTIVLITHRTSAIGVTNKLLVLRDGTAAVRPDQGGAAALQPEEQQNSPGAAAARPSSATRRRPGARQPATGAGAPPAATTRVKPRNKS